MLLDQLSHALVRCGVWVGFINGDLHLAVPVAWMLAELGQLFWDYRRESQADREFLQETNQ